MHAEGFPPEAHVFRSFRFCSRALYLGAHGAWRRSLYTMGYILKCCEGPSKYSTLGFL